MSELWPAIPFKEWEDTCTTLQLWTQIIGKVRLALTPWVNHSWHVVLYPTARGLTTSPIPYPHGEFQIDFDFAAHELIIAQSEGPLHRISLRPQTVADFYAQVMSALKEHGIEVHIDPRPNEFPNPIPFPEDRTHRSYDGEAVQRFLQALLSAHRVLSEFRSGFIGKVSPVHFFWGSFDLAVTRFSGRQAPLHPGGVPGLPDKVTREAYSHEVSSAGFWPGNGGLGYPAFYSYAYPEPKGYAESPIAPKAAFYHKEMREYLLAYEEVRKAADPEKYLLEFLESTYRAAAKLGNWDGAHLECSQGLPRIPRTFT